MNQWAKRLPKPPDDRFTWVVIHAWSKFPAGDGKELAQYDAFVECAKRLDSNIQVVTPTELARRLHEAKSRAAER